MEHMKPFIGLPSSLIYNLPLHSLPLASHVHINPTHFTCLQSLHLPYCSRFTSYPTILMTCPSQNMMAPIVLSGWLIGDFGCDIALTWASLTTTQLAPNSMETTRGLRLSSEWSFTPLPHIQQPSTLRACPVQFQWNSSCLCFSYGSQVCRNCVVFCRQRQNTEGFYAWARSWDMEGWDVQLMHSTIGFCFGVTMLLSPRPPPFTMQPHDVLVRTMGLG